MSQQNYPTTTVYQRKKSHKELWITLGIVAAVLVACFGGLVAVSGSTVEKGNALPDVTALQATDNPDVDKTVAAPTKAAPTKVQTGITDEGTLVVPKEVKPGTYRAVVPADSSNCYWARLKGTSGSLEDIIANGNADAGAKVTVTIKKTDKAFETIGCGGWSKVS